MRIVFAALAACLALACAPAFAAPAMWSASRDGSTLYLFGSMHVLAPGIDWRTPLYDDAYAKSSSVWFETQADPPAADVMDILARHGLDPHLPLSNGLSRQGKAAITPLLAARGQSLSDIEAYRPWAAALLLSAAPLQARGYSVEQGADAVVTRQARREVKAIHTFETLEQQISLFAGLSRKDAMQYLEDVVGGKNALRGDQLSLEKAWLAGDVAAMERGLVEPLRKQRPALYAALLANRNLAWADRIAAQVRREPGQTLLINVGALHMVGRHSLPALLTARGWTIMRVQ